MRTPRLFSLLARVIGRQLRKNWAGSFAVVAIGAIAITLTSGFLANAASLQNRVDSLIASSNAPDIYLTTDPRKGYDVLEQDKLVEAIPEISAIEGRFYTYVSLSGRNALATIEPSLPVYSAPSSYAETAPDHSENHYFVIDQFLTQSKLQENQDTIQVGGKATVSIPLASFSLDDDTLNVLDYLLKPGANNPFRAENLELEFKVTASMHHLECSAHGTFNPTMFLCSSSYFRDTLREKLATSFTDLGLEAIWTLGFRDKMGWGDGSPKGSTANFPLANQYLLKVKEGNDLQKVSTKIKSFYEKKEVDNLYACQTLEESSAVKTLRTEISQAHQITFVFPIVFFAVALLVSLISVRQTILHERMDIGTFKALGMSKREIHRHYASKSLSLAFLGVLAGEIIGPFLVPAILGKKYDLLYDLPGRGYTFPVWPCLALAVVYLGATLLVSYLISRKEIKRKPVESMRPEPPRQRIKRVLHSKDSSWAQLSLKLAGRGIRSDPVKTGMVIIGVLGCTALLCCGYGIEDTIRYGVDTDPLIVSGADVTVFLSEDKSQETLHEVLQFKDTQGNDLITGYQPFSKKSLDVRHEDNIYYTSVHILDGYQNLTGTEVINHFDHAFPLDQVVISDKVARALKASAGNTISFVVNDVEVNAKIAYTIPIFYENGVFIHSDSPLLQGVVSSYNAIWVDAAKGKETEAETEIRKIKGVAMCDSEAKWRKRVEEAMGSILVMTTAIKVFAFLLAIVVLYDLGMLNFSERQREIATMKVLGFKEMEIMNSLLFETLSLSLIGIAGGLAIGFPFTKLVLYINQVELVDYLYILKPMSYLIAFLFTSILSLVVNLSLTFRIRKIMAVESLKSVE